MTKENYYEGIKHVVHISTDTEEHCEHCDVSFDHEKIAESINHYIEQHGYRLLHVGTESCHDMNGDLWHSSVAVLGVEKNLPKWSPPQTVAIEIHAPDGKVETIPIHDRNKEKAEKKR